MWRVEEFADEGAVLAVLLMASLLVVAVILWLARRQRRHKP